MNSGMRNRSAARCTWDRDHIVAFVVSEDGPITLFRHGVRRLRLGRLLARYSWCLTPAVTVRL